MMTVFTFLLAGLISLNTSNSTIVFNATPGKHLEIVYYGPSLGMDDVGCIEAAGYDSRQAYPAFGYSNGTIERQTEPAISIMHSDGSLATDLRMLSYEKKEVGGGEEMTFTLSDDIYPITVKLHYRSYVSENIIETWTTIYNDGNKAITLNRYYSGCLPIRKNDLWSSTFYCPSGCNHEAQVETAPLPAGIKLIKSYEGVRTTRVQRAEAMISLDGKPSEDNGRVIGAALEWIGNYEMRFVNSTGNYMFFMAGVCPDNAAYVLEGKKSLETPKLAYSFSAEGLGGVSRNFHRWGRTYRLSHGDRLRKILLNSWEGISFDIEEKTVSRMIEGAAQLGAELFVLDDGWFGGNKYPRNNGSMGLGDWNINPSKLPSGFKPLVNAADSQNLSFGLWIEPEMGNTKSELYEKHRNWFLQAPGREPICGRGGTQIILDMSNPQVQDFVFGVFDGIMKEEPSIKYVKWDANADFMEYGSPYLKHQGNLAVEYVRGLESVCTRIRKAYPEVTIQACASGGGRVNWGFLPWFDEFWVSDNTDAVDRVYIQWGTSYFYPAIAMAAHVSAVPNQMTGRTTSLKYRIDVAMSGRFGFELVPEKLTPEERSQCRKAADEYKEVAQTIQFGDLYRLQSPFENHRAASLMYVAEDKSEAVFFMYSITDNTAVWPERIPMRGLDASRRYRLTELDRYEGANPLSCEGKIFSGRFLMDNGIELPRTSGVKDERRNDWCSRVIKISEF